ncbi:MAG TPA: hypothetical protein VFW44_16390 [Bryobacteraceae bacterium]|nr:hypothetical protein [Bryobacteraceae bacterium]
MTTEHIGEGRGKRTSRRVLATQPQFDVEVSFEDSTNLLGAKGVNIGTYHSTNKPDGSLDGEGQGVFATLDGQIATWRAIGTGRFLNNGAVGYRGSISYTTTSSKLARLNALTGVFEFEVDKDGNTHSKFLEWK